MLLNYQLTTLKAQKSIIIYKLFKSRGATWLSTFLSLVVLSVV